MLELLFSFSLSLSVPPRPLHTFLFLGFFHPSDKEFSVFPINLLSSGIFALRLGLFFVLLAPDKWV